VDPVTGVNPKIVSERIGHASLAFTLQTYTHRSEGRDRDAAATVAALFVPSQSEAMNDREDQAKEQVQEAGDGGTG